MSLVSFVELEPQVLATLPACPTPTIVREIRNAARELCEDAKCLRTTVDNEPVLAGVNEIEFDIDENYVLVAPISLNVGERTLQATSPILLDEDYNDWRDEVGPPCKYMRSTETLNAIILFPKPDQNYTTEPLRGEIAVKPSRSATQIDEIFLERFETALVSGALSRLLMVSNTPWYNPQQASYHRTIFDGELDKAKSYGNGGDLPKLRKTRYGGI
jgi:hypothetical protein